MYSIYIHIYIYIIFIHLHAPSHIDKLTWAGDKMGGGGEACHPRKKFSKVGPKVNSYGHLSSELTFEKCEQAVGAEREVGQRQNSQK